jgi:O-antigen/teichoic acid export membrane protein
VTPANRNEETVKAAAPGAGGRKTRSHYSGDRVVVNAVTGAIFNPLNLLIGVVRFAFLVRLLPLTVYGGFLILTSVIAQFEFLDGGMRQSLQRYVPEFLAKNRKEDAARAITATLVIMVGVGVLTGGAVALFVALGGANVFGAEGRDPHLINGLYLAAAALGLFWPLSTFESGLQSLNHFNEVVILRFLTELVRSVALIAGAVLGWSVEFLFLAYLVPGMLMQLWLAGRLQRLLATPLLRVDRGTIAVLREIWHYSKWVAFGQISGVLNNSVDRPIVAAALGVGALPIYYGLRTATRALSSLSLVLQATLLPTSSHRVARGDLASVKAMIIKGTRAQMAFFTPFALAIILFAHPLLELWGGAAIASYAPALQIAVLLFLFTASRKVLDKVAASLNALIRFLTLVNLATAILSSLGIYAFGRLFGIYGAFLTPMVVTNLLIVFRYRYLLAQFGVSARDYILKGFCAGLGPAAVLAMLLWPGVAYAERMLSPSAMLAFIAASGFAMFGVSFLFGLDKDSRTRLIRVIGESIAWKFRAPAQGRSP